jgi:hypothetical protein
MATPEAIKERLKAAEVNKETLDLSGLGLSLMPQVFTSFLFSKNRFVRLNFNLFFFFSFAQFFLAFFLVCWQSVFTSFSFIANMDLGFNRFSIFPEVFAFESLTQLILSGNQITAIPPQIKALKNLRQLFINGTVFPLNDLTFFFVRYLLTGKKKTGNALKEVPDEIGELALLEKLDLANNQISMISEKIGKLHRLEELNLTGNMLKTLPPSIGACKAMEVHYPILILLSFCLL